MFNYVDLALLCR